MRVKILGDNLGTRTLRGYVEHLGYAVVETLPDFTVILSEYGEDVIVDGIDCDLERQAIKNFEDLGIGRFILERAGGIRSDRELRISYPQGKDQVIARGLARALLEAFGVKGAEKKVEAVHKSLMKQVKDGVKVLFSLPLLLLLLFFLPTKIEAQQFYYGRAWDSVNLAGVDPGDSVNRALRVNVVASAAAGSDVNLVSISGVSLTGANVVDGGNTAFRVNCVTGCVAGGSFADSTAFTFGTTPVSNTSFVVDDTGTNTVAENSAGAARMNANRIAYFDISKTTANTTAILTTGTGGTFPVTGTVTTTPPANASTNITQFGGTNISTGTGASGAGIPRVTISNDSSLAANQSVNVNQIGGTSVVVRACEREQQIYVQISQTTGTQLITGTASERIYICSFQLVTATAQNIALVDGTGSVCATSPTGLLGGSTAATGWNFAANGGIVLPNTSEAWTKTSTDADNVCLLQSGSGQISGSLSYISQPNL